MRHSLYRVNIWGLCLVTALIGGPDLGVMAQAPVAVSDAPQVAAPNLAAALAGAHPPMDGLALTVGGEGVSRLPDAAPPGVQPSVAEAADEYGRITQRFGGVTAVAPPSMTVLHPDPATEDPMNELSLGEAFKLLLGSLDDQQWALLTGETGLGMADLDDSQQNLFMALFPNGVLIVQEAGGKGESTTLKETDVRQIRLRLGQQTMIGLPFPGGGYNLFPPLPPPGQSGPRAIFNYALPADVKPDARHIRDTVPNTLKPSDLDYNGGTWQTLIDPGGVKTVGDLIARIGTATATEMYADRHFEARNVTLLGQGKVAAGDLLRALALCLCGAYRRVGTAYVLSDDIVGLRTQRLLATRTPDDVLLARAKATTEAGDRLFTRGGMDALPLRDGPALTDAQREAKSLIGRSVEPIHGIDRVLDWAQLTPEQQDLARRESQAFPQQSGMMVNLNGTLQPLRPTLNGRFHVTTRPLLQILSPRITGIIRMEGNWDFNLFNPATAVWAASLDRLEKLSAHKETSSAKPLPPAASLLARFPRRAVRARVRKAGEIAGLVAALKRLHANELWLDVPTEAQKDSREDILTEAIAETGKAGMTMVPTLDLLNWGPNAPEDARDGTLLGETSAQVHLRQERLQEITQGDEPPDAEGPATIAVCPAAASVRQTLLALVRHLAATPGVAALALRGTETPGYDITVEDGEGSPDDLGYTTPLRLAFLRRWHADPVDPLNIEGSVKRISFPDTSVPEFDGDWRGKDLTNEWAEARRDAGQDLLRQLLAAAKDGAGRPTPLLIKRRGLEWTADWYGSWDRPSDPLPFMTRAAVFDVKNVAGFARFAHTLSRSALYTLTVRSGESLLDLSTILEGAGAGWDGVVLDVSDHPGGDALSGLLDPPADKAGGGTPASVP